MAISKQVLSGAKIATLLAMSWSLGVALESRLETAPAHASDTVAPPTADAPATPAKATSWWKPAADALL